MPEIYWKDDPSPERLRRRANDLEADGLLEMGRLLRERADEIEAERPNTPAQDLPDGPMPKKK